MEKRSKEIENHMFMKVEVETNGYSPKSNGVTIKDGYDDTYSFTNLEFINGIGIHWGVAVNGEFLNLDNDNLRSVAICFSGNAELSNLIESLEFAVKSLKEMKGNRGVDSY